VTVDGAPAHLGQKVDPETAWVEVDGVALPIKPGLVFYLLYKPVGVISTTDDPQQRQTVIDLVPGHTRVYPVGRLDADSEGLLVLTNDGALTERVTHPRYGITKTYLVEVDGSIGGKALSRLTKGVDLDDGPARAVGARVVDEGRSRSLVEVTMAEGRKREVRRMFDIIGHPVRRLVREAIGPIRDRQLKPGEWRDLSVAEVRSLYAAATEQ
jgi:23S rRNA pseudouridine2605 synthase